jgi:hypothetical protein
MKNFVWDEENNTIRGSFINIALTIFYACIIVASLIWNRIAENVAEITSFLVGFYGVSFTVWAGKKTIEMIRKVPDKYGTMITQIFDKVKPESKPEDKQ